MRCAHAHSYNLYCVQGLLKGFSLNKVVCWGYFYQGEVGKGRVKHQDLLMFGLKKRTDTDRYFIDIKKVITDLFVIEMKEIYVHVYTRLLIY